MSENKWQKHEGELPAVSPWSHGELASSNTSFCRTSEKNVI